MAETTITKSNLKGKSHREILAETDHFFTEAAGECFLLNEMEFHLVEQLEALEDSGGSFARQRALIVQIRAVIRSIAALGCANTVVFPR